MKKAMPHAPPMGQLVSDDAGTVLIAGVHGAGLRGFHSHGFRPHDLVWVADPAGLHGRGDLPGWCVRWLQEGASTPVVIRRENTGDPTLLPVGIRGTHRHQRQAAYLQRSAVARVLSPEHLVSSLELFEDGAAFGPAPRRDSGAPAMWATTSHSIPSKRPWRIYGLSDVLRAFLPALARLGLPWGPTGGLGFALATGLPVLHAGSDIDLLVRAPAPLSQAQGQVLAALVETVERATCMVDIQIDTRFGGFAFKEWTACDPGRVGGAALPGAAPQRVAEARRVLLKTEAGPILVRDPWRRQPAEGLQVQHPRPGPAASTARGFDQAL